MSIMIALLVIRVILLLASFRYLKVCKYYIYLYTVLYSVDFLHARNLDYNAQSWILALTQIIIFILFYFEFWSSLLCNCSSQLVLLLVRYYLYNEVINSVVINWLVFNLLWTCFFCAIIHIVITLVGFTFVKSEILRSGNE